MRFDILFAAVCFAFPAWAEPLTLKCTTDTGEPVSDLNIDLDAGKATWGQSPEGKYEIVGVTDKYLTLQQTSRFDDIGGETWVLDRTTGDYERAAVYIACVNLVINGKCSSEKLVARTFLGKCVRPVL